MMISGLSLPALEGFSFSGSSSALSGAPISAPFTAGSISAGQSSGFNVTPMTAVLILAGVLVWKRLK